MVSWDTRVPSSNLVQGFVVFHDTAYQHSAMLPVGCLSSADVDLHAVVRRGGTLPSRCSSASSLCKSFPCGATKWINTGERAFESRRFRSVPRTFPGSNRNPGNIFFVFLFTQ